MKSRAAGLLLAALATASAGLAGGPAARAATQPICVGVVVDFADLGGGTDASCAKVPAGSSGSEVLTAAGHRVTFDPRYGDDFVCAIDGEPAGGCDSVDSSHFWAYYHRAPGSTAWHYSAEGPGTYEPADGSSEGWIYNDGQDPPPVPPDVGYRSMCPQTASPAPSPTPTHRQTADRSGTSTTGGQQLKASAAPTSTPPSGAATPQPTTRTDDPRHHDRSRTAGRRPGTDDRRGRATTSAAAPTAQPEAAPATSSTGGLPTGLIAGGGLLVALAGAGAWQVRRRT